MARIVMKFGGTSSANIDALRLCAKHVARQLNSGDEVAVVISAPSGMTAELSKKISEVDEKSRHLDEADLILSSGEQINAGLLVIILREMGLKAKSWSGWQAGLITDDNHGEARLIEARTGDLCDSLKAGEIAVMTGFQGVSKEGRITTLGRGGSDVSAVALATAIQADRCDIYTDVAGVFTADPAIEENAKLILKLSPEEMLELASSGTKVLHSRSVELAMSEQMPLRVLSTFKSGSGTVIAKGLETHLVSGVTYSRDVSQISLMGLAGGIDSMQQLFSALAKKNINIDLVVQSSTRQTGLSNLVFATSKSDHDRALSVVRSDVLSGLYQNLNSVQEMAKVSVVGLGLRSQSGMLEIFFRALAEANISMHAVATSELRISALIPEHMIESAVKALHFAYGLDKALT
ncbi:aspartate kinase [Oceanicaulis sp. AH-315-P02]|nr:aspartate kinase [Oceanicaulis sp. AH-315-P02]